MSRSGTCFAGNGQSVRCEVDGVAWGYIRQREDGRPGKRSALSEEAGFDSTFQQDESY
jgi:hypothetical protein